MTSGLPPSNLLKEKKKTKNLLCGLCSVLAKVVHLCLGLRSLCATIPLDWSLWPEQLPCDGHVCPVPRSMTINETTISTETPRKGQ